MNDLHAFLINMGFVKIGYNSKLIKNLNEFDDKTPTIEFYHNKNFMLKIKFIVDYSKNKVWLIRSDNMISNDLTFTIKDFKRIISLSIVFFR